MRHQSHHSAGSNAAQQALQAIAAADHFASIPVAAELADVMERDAAARNAFARGAAQ
jgi:hypothetical protein